VSTTQYDYDFEYDTGRTIPQDSAGWRNFANARNQNLLTWVDNALPDSNDNLFFNIPYSKQKSLRKQNPSLEEAWKIYLTLLQVANE